MSNPLSLFPIALAAGGGSVDGVPAAGAVAAGFTLLQRSAPLVRSMAGRRSALLLPSGAAFLTALAASDGRGAVLLCARSCKEEIAARFDDADVGAIFTVREAETTLPAGDRVIVLLDDAPRSAMVIVRESEMVVDLGSHFGLDLEGEEDAGRDEECVISYAAASGAPLGATFTHRNLLALARGAVDATSLLKDDHVLACMPSSNLAAFALTMAGPLLAGARVTTMNPFDADEALRHLEQGTVTMFSGDVGTCEAVVEALESRATPLEAPALRVVVCVGTLADSALQNRWHQWTGTELRQAFGLTEAPLSLFNAPHFPNRRGTLGIPFPGVQVSVRNPITGAPVSHGGDGELWLRGAPVSSGYLHPAADGLRRSDGWLQTHERMRERGDGAFERAAD